MEVKRILLVEDDANLGFVIADNLSTLGYQVTRARDGMAGWDTFISNSFDLCILDVMMPKADGFTLARQIREKDTDIPILFLTAKTMTEDKLEGFRSGGDDYIVKPFAMEELRMRIEVFLKRSGKSLVSTAAHPDTYQIGKFSFDPDNLTLAKGNTSKKLTRKEAHVLSLFCQHLNVVLKREIILKEVWGDDDYFIGRSLDVFVSKLRKYLKADERVQIVNYHGVGFKLEIKS